MGGGHPRTGSHVHSLQSNGFSVEGNADDYCLLVLSVDECLDGTYARFYIVLHKKGNAG